MKNAFSTTLALFAMLAMTACSTLNADGTAQSPEQVAAQFCPSATIALTSLQALEGVSATDTLALANISDIVTPVCAAVASGGLVTTTDLKSFATQYSPILVSIVKASSLDVDKKNRIVLDLAVAQIAIAALPSTAPIGQ